VALEEMEPGAKVAHLLKGHEVVDSFNCHELRGLRRTDGLFVITKRSICFLSNFFLNPGGEVVENFDEDTETRRHPNRVRGKVLMSDTETRGHICSTEWHPNSKPQS